MIEINVTGQRMTIADGAEFVQNSVNVYECSFTFDSAWDGFAKTAVFRREAGTGDPIEVPMTEDQCTVPHGVLESTGRLRIGVYGVKDDVVYPTVWGPSVYIQPGTPTQGTTEESIDQTHYTELLELVQENTQEIQAISEEIEEKKYRLVLDETQNGTSAFDLENIQLTHAKVIIKIPKNTVTDKKYAVVFGRKSGPTNWLTIAVPIVPFVLETAASSNLFPRCDMHIEHGMWEQETTYPDLTTVPGLNKHFVESYMQEGILFKAIETYFQNPNYGTQCIEHIYFVKYSDDDGYGYPRASAAKAVLPSGFEVMIYGVDYDD
jgi:hypothetical protein